MTIPRETWSLPSRQLGNRVQVFDRVESTNTLALSMANDPNQHGLTLLAREQSAGRGQYGRSWQAPPASSVLLSILLFPPVTLHRPALLTAWAAVSVGETVLKAVNLQAKIKWPNDVLIAGKKVCGILIEQRTTGIVEHPLATVVGIGLNVNQTAEMFQAADLPSACSLASASGCTLSHDEIAKQLILELDAQYGALLDGDHNTLESVWKWRLGLLGRRVAVEGNRSMTLGRLLDATFAHLTLEVAPDEIVRIPTESVRHVSAVAEAL